MDTNSKDISAIFILQPTFKLDEAVYVIEYHRFFPILKAGVYPVSFTEDWLP